MLYDILLIMLVVYVMFSPIFIIESIKFGVKLASKPDQVADIPVLNIKLPKKKPKKTKEQKKAEQAAAQKLEETAAILENIDIFDGTNFGQKEIKNGIQ